MKTYLIPIIILSVCACSNAQNKGLKFNKTNSKGVLIGENIELLDNDLNKIDDISNLSGKIIDIVSVSDSLYNQSDNICDAFWFVKIKSANIDGIVNGRQVFEIQNSIQDTSFIIEDNQIEILTTDFLVYLS